MIAYFPQLKKKFQFSEKCFVLSKKKKKMDLSSVFTFPDNEGKFYEDIGKILATH